MSKKKNTAAASDAPEPSTDTAEPTEAPEAAKEKEAKGPRALKLYRVVDADKRPSVREKSKNSEMRDLIEQGGDTGTTSRAVADVVGVPREHVNDYMSRGVKRGWLEVAGSTAAPKNANADAASDGDDDGDDADDGDPSSDE